jgi:DNA-binding IclR family transcriptional regulator
LRDETHECCFVSMLVDQQVVCLQTMESDNPHRARFYHRPGQIMPIHASAAGKAIVAFQPPAVQDEILAQMKLERFTPRTIVSLDDFRTCLRTVKERGFALCEEELELGVSAAAAPIADLQGRVRASVTAVAPTVRIQNGLEDGLIASLQAAARQMGLFFES